MTQWKDNMNKLNNNSIKHMSKKIIIDCRRSPLAKKGIWMQNIMQ